MKFNIIPSRAYLSFFVFFVNWNYELVVVIYKLLMQKVKRDALYLTPNSKQLFKKIDYGDTFSTTNHKNSLEEIVNLIFDNPPPWIIALLLLRNAIVKLVGLKTSFPAAEEKKFEVGNNINFFKIYQIHKDEVVLGAEDSHLNFRAVINKTNAQQHNIKVTTLVEYNNLLGKIYMTLITPGHLLIMRVLVKKAFYQA